MADEVELTVHLDKPKSDRPRELPKEELHDAVIVDLIDLGMVEGEWQGKKTLKRKCRYVFELETKRTDGKHFNVRTRDFNATLAPKAALELFASDVTGVKFTDETRPKFKASSLLGEKVRILIKHMTSKNDNVFPAIVATMRGGTFAGSGLYKRWVPEDKYNSAKGTEKKAAPVAEEQLPF